MEQHSAVVWEWLRLRLAELGVGLLSALVVLLVGLVVARLVSGVANAALLRSPVRRRMLLVGFLTRTVRVVVVVFAAVVALGQLGVDIAPLIAGIGITGFVVGFAFKDSLSNLAAGLLLLFYQPFDVGDLVEVSGIKGTVLDMTIVATDLRTEEGRLAIVPNSKIWNAPILNHSRLQRPAAEG